MAARREPQGRARGHPAALRRRPGARPRRSSGRGGRHSSPSDMDRPHVAARSLTRRVATAHRRLLRPVYRASPNMLIDPTDWTLGGRRVPLRAWYPIEVFRFPAARSPTMRRRAARRTSRRWNAAPRRACGACVRGETVSGRFASRCRASSTTPRTRSSAPRSARSISSRSTGRSASSSSGSPSSRRAFWPTVRRL